MRTALPIAVLLSLLLLFGASLLLRPTPTEGAEAVERDLPRPARAEVRDDPAPAPRPRPVRPSPPTLPLCAACAPSAIEGSVVRADSTPFAGARVRLVGSFGNAPSARAVRFSFEVAVERETETNETGAFLFEGIPPLLRYLLEVRAPGFADAHLGPFSPDPGRRDSAGDVRLPDGASLEGTVTDEGGRPLPEARVAAIPSPRGESRDAFLPYLDADAATPVDEEGRFRARHAHAGRLVVAAYASGRTLAAEAIEVSPGESRRVVNFRLPKGGSIRGVVVERGESVPGAIVAARAPGDAPSFLARTGEDGAFAIEGALPDAAYRLEAASGAFRSSRVVVRAGDSPVRLELKPSGEIRGTVLDASTGRPPPFALVRAFSDAPDWTLPLRDLSLARLAAPTDARGRFALPPPGPGAWRVVAYGPGFAPVATGRRGPGPSDPVEIHLHRGTTIRGVTKGGGKLLRASVSLYAALDSERGAKGPIAGATRADSAGRFEFLGAPEGDWLLEATHEGFAPARDGPFHVAPQQSRVEIDLTLLRPAGVKGFLFRGGAPARGLKVVATTEEGVARAATPDGAGTFALFGLPPGRLWVLVVPADLRAESFDGVPPELAKGAALAMRETLVAPGAIAEVVFDLEEKGRGRVAGLLRRHGAPAALLGVVLAPDDPSLPGGAHAETTSDSDGRFTFDGLAPGRYAILVRGRVGPGVIDFLLERRSIEVGESRASVEIDLATGRLRGRVVAEETGEGIAGARIVVSVDRERGGAEPMAPDAAWSGTSGPQGDFDLGEAPAGAYRLETSASGWLAATNRVALATGQEWIPEVRLARAPDR